MNRYTFVKEKFNGIPLNTENAFLLNYYARLRGVALVRWY